MMRVGGFGDMFEDSALKVDAGFEALGEDVGEVDGCVDADGGEGGGVVEALGFGFGEEVELVGVC